MFGLNNKLKKILQGKKTINRTIFQYMLENGFCLKNAQKAMLVLNGISIQSLSDDSISHVSIYETLRGQRKSDKAKKILADSVGLTVDEFFPKDGRAAVYKSRALIHDRIKRDTPQ